ncbi:MAG: ANTAR domain-containing protein [Pseudonocardiaceae bacterium]|nr:MAG: ANTAR domain-containing protein [Pseudonocardiaceae bacterium]
MSADELSPDSSGAHSWAVEFSALAAALDSATSRQESLERVVSAGVALLPAADMVSISLRRDDGSFLTAAPTAPLAARLDELQYSLREGPCVLASGRAGLGMFASSDLGTDPLVSRWGPAAVREGVHSALAVGLFAHEEPPRVGALNFFAFSRGALDDADHDAAVVLAAHAAAVLHAHEDAEAAARENENLREALRNRDVIGQAKGILMEREGIGEEAAFAILRSVSQRMNVKLSEIARTVTDRHGEL